MQFSGLKTRWECMRSSTEFQLAWECVFRRRVFHSQTSQSLVFKRFYFPIHFREPRHLAKIRQPRKLEMRTRRGHPHDREDNRRAPWHRAPPRRVVTDKTVDDHQGDSRRGVCHNGATTMDTGECKTNIRAAAMAVFSQRSDNLRLAAKISRQIPIWTGDPGCCQGEALQ